MTPTSTKPPVRRRPAISARVVLAALAVVAVLAGTAILVSGSKGSSKPGGGTSGQVRPVQVSGAALPVYADGSASDPAVAAPAPVVSGTAFDGSATTIGGRGQPTLVMFVAHWCPHCQREVPLVTSWVEAGAVPAGVRLVAVATATNPSYPNYPPSSWLARVGWPGQILVDDGQGSAASAYGLPAFPYFVALNGDGTVAARATGELTRQQFDAVVAALH